MGYKNLNKIDPVVHSRSAKGMKTYGNPRINVTRTSSNKNVKWSRLPKLFKYQDEHLENTSLRESGTMRSRGSALEAAGDIFRELTGSGGFVSRKQYIAEKIRRINTTIEDVRHDEQLLKERDDLDVRLAATWGTVNERDAEEFRKHIRILRADVDASVAPKEQKKALNESLDLMQEFTYQKINTVSMKKELGELEASLPKESKSV